VAQLQQFIGEGVKGRQLAQPPLLDEGDRPAQFGGHDVHIQLHAGGREAAVHFTIDAVEVAMFVRIDVDADGQAAGAGGNDEIYEIVVEEIAGAAEGRGARGQHEGAAPGFGALAGLGCVFVDDCHNIHLTMARYE